MKPQVFCDEDSVLFYLNNTQVFSKGISTFSEKRTTSEFQDHLFNKLSTVHASTLQNYTRRHLEDCFEYTGRQIFRKHNHINLEEFTTSVTSHICILQSSDKETRHIARARLKAGIMEVKRRHQQSLERDSPRNKQQRIEGPKPKI